jgi:hypothetical protein
MNVFSPTSTCGFLHGNFYRVRFFLRPPRQLVVFFYTWFFTQYTFSLAPLHAVFLHGNFLTECVFPPAPLSTGSFFLQFAFYTFYSFLPPLHAVSLHEKFLQSALLRLVPPSTGNFYIQVLHKILFLPPYVKRGGGEIERAKLHLQSRGGGRIL